MAFDKNVTVRVDSPWVKRLARVMNLVSERGSRDRSRVIRQFVAKDISFWLDSPYVAYESRHFLLVRANGDMVYHDLRELELKTARIRLPAMVTMKAEKAEEFLQRYQGESDTASAMRRHWLLNHFAVWYGTDTSAPPLVTHVDRLGVTSKGADMPINLGADTLVTREVVASNRDYVQRRASRFDSAKDRGGVAIDFPTMELDLRVMVDLDLYGDNEDLRDSAGLNFSFRNPEGALCGHVNIDSVDNPITWNDDRYPDPLYKDFEYEEDLEAVRDSFDVLQKRLAQLAEPSTLGPDGQPVVEDHARATLAKIEMPKRFLFGRFRWPMPYVGLEVCANWNKPDPRP